jgi:hypothetical protein
MIYKQHKLPFLKKVGYQGVMATALVTVTPPPFSPL